jgi:uncharacterized protein YaaQ
MKLILAIIHDDDTLAVTSALNASGISVTKLSSTGGFLRSGNTTLLIGLEDNSLEEAIEAIKNNSKKRFLPKKPNGSNEIVNIGKKIEVGGATIFIMGIERFEKA